MMSKLKSGATVAVAALLIVIEAAAVFSAPNGPHVTAAGALDWKTNELTFATELDLAAAGLRFPEGRNRAEEILLEEYIALVRRFISTIQVDSSSTIGDLIQSNEFSLRVLDEICFAAKRVPPHFSADLTRFSGSYSLRPSHLSAAFIRHRQAAEPIRPLIPSPAAAYTGIIIIADSALPIHGRNTTALVTPCLFPKIWDSGMNLVYERNMTDPAIFSAGERNIVRYTTAEAMLRPTPSGLDEELAGLVGDRPLRVFARSVFGAVPTDPVIDREDALLIVSNENNRRLLREGKVVFVVNSEELNRSAEFF